MPPKPGGSDGFVCNQRVDEPFEQDEAFDLRPDHQPPTAWQLDKTDSINTRDVGIAVPLRDFNESIMDKPLDGLPVDVE
jgi:hypothetical protein